METDEVNLSIAHENDFRKHMYPSHNYFSHKFLQNSSLNTEVKNLSTVKNAESTLLCNNYNIIANNVTINHLLCQRRNKNALAGISARLRLNGTSSFNPSNNKLAMHCLYQNISSNVNNTQDNK